MCFQYRNFLKVVEMWPLDKNKVNRDIAEHLRARLPVLRKSLTTQTSKEKERIFNQTCALNRLSKNIYNSNFKRIHFSTATGLSAKQCSQVLSSEFLEYLKNGDQKK